MKPQTFRRRWEPYCDHCDASREIASWYDSDIHRLRVAYYVRRGVAMLMCVLPGGNWRVVERRNWTMLPAHAKATARRWLEEESARRWPEHAPDVSLVDTMHNGRWRMLGRLRTVKK